MFELDIQIKVALHTGAEVQLTPEQTKRIKNYATEVLLGAPALPVSTKTQTSYRKSRRKTFHKWTPEYDEIIMEIIKRYAHLPDGVSSSARVEDLKRAHKDKLNKFTYIAVYSRYVDKNKEFRRQQKEIQQANSWTSVAIKL